jgi:hypothetical protein
MSVATAEFPDLLLRRQQRRSRPIGPGRRGLRANGVARAGLRDFNFAFSSTLKRAADAYICSPARRLADNFLKRAMAVPTVLSAGFVLFTEGASA